MKKHFSSRKSKLLAFAMPGCSKISIINPMKGTNMNVNVFWDNSNIMWVGRNFSMSQEPGHEHDFRIHISNLYQFAVNNRNVSCAFAAVSTPPQNKNLRLYFTKLGITVVQQ